MTRLVTGLAMRLTVGLVIALSTGCSPDPGELMPLQAPDRVDFEREAGPLLVRRCGDISCHGRPERPFALYRDNWDLNYQSTRGFLDSPNPRRSTLLHKALGGEGIGGHAGGGVFEAPSDPEFRAIEAWARTAEDAP